MYWGELIYATPGCGKTYVANKYRDVVDGDDILVRAIIEVSDIRTPDYVHTHYDDPRTAIFRYFRYIRFNRRIMNIVYNSALDKMRDACEEGDVVLLGTKDLMEYADRIFIEKNDDFVRAGFETKQWMEQENADASSAPVHNIYEYLDNSLHRVCRRGRY